MREVGGGGGGGRSGREGWPQLTGEAVVVVAGGGHEYASRQLPG